MVFGFTFSMAASSGTFRNCGRLGDADAVREAERRVALERLEVDRVHLPALIITAQDDPFVPSEPFRDPEVTGNPHITLRLCEYGGHCGFVGPKHGIDDGYWAEHQIVDFIELSGEVKGSDRGLTPV